MAHDSQASTQAGFATEDHRPLPERLAARPAPGSRLGRLTGGGTDGNERLTSATGILLLVLLAALGITILRIGPLLDEHMFLGMLLIGPVALKMGSTGYRFVRYYTFEERYRRKGPPQTPLRLLAPFVVISTIVVFASGVALMLLGPSSRHLLLPVHKVSFFCWIAVTALHVLAHLADLPRVLKPSATRGALLIDAGDAHSGRDGRALALGGAIFGGAVLGIISISQFGAWTHTHFLHH